MVSQVPVEHAWQALAADRCFALPPEIRRPLELALDADFSDVAIHTTPLAHRLNRQLGAQAFAWGRHIAFAEGAYSPSSLTGMSLLAHELAHVVQQRLGAARIAPANEGQPNVAAIEWEAHGAAAAAV